MSKRTWKDEQLIEAVITSYSVSQVIQKLQLIPAGGNYKSIQQHIRRLSLNTEHFLGQGHLKGKTHQWGVKKALNELLQENSTYMSHPLKKRLTKEGVLQDACSQCKITHWEGRKLSLHLDHINGINTDNRLINLRLLCPNCHSLTETYCGKNIGKK